MTENIAYKKPIDGALHMFNKGFKVFPLIPNSKLPAFEGWQDWAKTANEKRIKSFGIAQPTSNWGVFCDTDLTVIDIDTKNGVDGFAAFKKLIADNQPLPNTFTVTSPTGSKHLYYYGEGKNSASLLGKGIDTRGKGGYVVAPGSRIDDRIYEVTNNSEIESIPTWLNNKINNSKKEITVLNDNHLVEEGERNQTLVSLAGTMRRRGMNYEAILAALMAVNENQLETPISNQEVEIIARSVSKYKPEEAQAASDFIEIKEVQSISADSFTENDIPKRDWIMKNRYIGGFVSVIVAPGGVGKSTLSMLDAASIATGKPLTGFDVVKPGGVWIYNTEDPIDELQRRISAISKHYGVSKTDLSNIHITSGRERPLVIAKNNKNGIVINENAIDKVIEHIKEKNIVLLIADPFVGTHECSENDNMQINKVVHCFRKIAGRTGCAVALIHHMRKPGANGTANGDANTSRGASSLVDATRIAHTIAPMTEDEAKKFGLGETKKGWYMRLDNAKANLQPPAERADWFKKISVILINGDTVGTIEKVDLVSKRDEKLKEEREADRVDLANCLSEIMNIGDLFSAKEVFGQILLKPKYSHIFANFKSDTEARFKRGQEHLIKLIDEGLYKGSKKFFYVFAPEKRPSQWICCEETEEFLR